MALTAAELEGWINQYGPYLYHGTYPERAAGILKRGLVPGTDLRTTHVYLARAEYASAYADGAPAQIRVDLRLLDPAAIDFDPDFYLGELDPEDLLVEDGFIWTGPAIAEGDDLPDDEDERWKPIDEHYLVEPSSSEDTLRSLDAAGSCSHRGPIGLACLEPNPAWLAWRAQKLR